MNRVILLATLTKDVELCYLQNGSAMAALNLAHNKLKKRKLFKQVFQRYK